MERVRPLGVFRENWPNTILWKAPGITPLGISGFIHVMVSGGPHFSLFSPGNGAKRLPFSPLALTEELSGPLRCSSQKRAICAK
jgi:hypothetical protein